MFEGTKKAIGEGARWATGINNVGNAIDIWKDKDHEVYGKPETSFSSKVWNIGTEVVHGSCKYMTYYGLMFAQACATPAPETVGDVDAVANATLTNTTRYLPSICDYPPNCVSSALTDVTMIVPNAIKSCVCYAAPERCTNITLSHAILAAGGELGNLAWEHPVAATGIAVAGYGVYKTGSWIANNTKKITDFKNSSFKTISDWNHTIADTSGFTKGAIGGALAYTNFGMVGLATASAGAAVIEKFASRKYNTLCYLVLNAGILALSAMKR